MHIVWIVLAVLAVLAAIAGTFIFIMYQLAKGMSR
jgi:hypothetical protein